MISPRHLSETLASKDVRRYARPESIRRHQTLQSALVDGGVWMEAGQCPYCNDAYLRVSSRNCEFGQTLF
jgi:hypothetical protein